MTNFLKALGILTALYVGFVGVVTLGPTHGFLVGPGMATTTRTIDVPVVGTAYPIPGNHRFTFRYVGPVTVPPDGYGFCHPDSPKLDIRCTNSRESLPSCPSGTTTDLCDDNYRIEGLTASATTIRNSYATKRILPPATLTPPRYTLLDVQIHNAYAIIGDSFGVDGIYVTPAFSINEGDNQYFNGFWVTTPTGTFFVSGEGFIT